MSGYKAIIATLGPKPKTISGNVLQDGLDFVTVSVINPDGTKSMKRFSKNKYRITITKE